jgi:membrane protein
MHKASQENLLLVIGATVVGWFIGALGGDAVPRDVALRAGALRVGALSAGTGAGAGAAPAPAPAAPRGWWAMAKLVFWNISDHRLMTEAAGITFYALLAIFPALGAMVSLYGLFADPHTVSEHLTAVSGFVPGGGMDIISDQVKVLASNNGSALTFGLVLGLATSLWSANAGMKALFDSLNVVYSEPERRSYLVRTALSMALTVGGLVFVLVAIGGVVALPVVLAFVGLSSETDLLLRLARWPALLVVLALFLAVIYRFGPSRLYAKWRWITGGSMFATLVWVAGSVAFSWYVSNFGSYNKTYGSLGAAVGFMTWIWLSATVVLVGAELDCVLERRDPAP